MATAVVIFLIVVFLKTVISDDVRTLTNKKLCPSLFTIMLQNLPPIEEPELIAWVQDRFGEKPVVINWSFNVMELERTHKEKGNAVIEMNKIKIKLREYAREDASNNNPILNDIKKDEKSTKDL